MQKPKWLRGFAGSRGPFRQAPSGCGYTADGMHRAEVKHATCIYSLQSHASFLSRLYQHRGVVLGFKWEDTLDKMQHPRLAGSPGYRSCFFRGSKHFRLKFYREVPPMFTPWDIEVSCTGERLVEKVVAMSRPRGSFFLEKMHLSQRSHIAIDLHGCIYSCDIYLSNLQGLPESEGVNRAMPFSFTLLW
jgi:hypothetical protein